MVVCTNLENAAPAMLVAGVKLPATCPMDRRVIDASAKIKDARSKRGQGHGRGLDYASKRKLLRHANIPKGGCIS
jgi:hypothetical protein